MTTYLTLASHNGCQSYIENAARMMAFTCQVLKDGLSHMFFFLILLILSTVPGDLPVVSCRQSSAQKSVARHLIAQYVHHFKAHVTNTSPK